MANKCDGPTMERLKKCGCSEEHLAKVGALPSVNWLQLLALVEQYGPQIIAALLSVFGQPTPAPTPPSV